MARNKNNYYYEVYNLYNGVTVYTTYTERDACKWIDNESDSTGWDEWDNYGVRRRHF